MSVRTSGRVLWVATRMVLAFTLILGIGYTLAITAIGQIAFPDRANGSLIRNADGQVVASSLIGQSFSDADGAPLARYFQPRPSAAEYDAQKSGGSNAGPENPTLIRDIKERRNQIARFNGVAPASIPADALTASASGLEPDISPRYAALQEARVARARHLSLATVKKLVAQHTTQPYVGFIGEPVVNVVMLNEALDRQKG